MTYSKLRRRKRIAFKRWSSRRIICVKTAMKMIQKFIKQFSQSIGLFSVEITRAMKAVNEFRAFLLFGNCYTVIKNDSPYYRF